MTQSEILQSVQTQLLILSPIGDIKDSTIFYNDLISEMPYHEYISSFLIGVNTSGNQQLPESNLTIITMDYNLDEDTQDEITSYIDKKINTGHEYIESTWLSNTLIIPFDY